MMKGSDSRESKCYAFVTFRTKDLASKAIEKLNNSELKVILGQYFAELFLLLYLS